MQGRAQRLEEWRAGPWGLSFVSGVTICRRGVASVSLFIPMAEQDSAAGQRPLDSVPIALKNLGISQKEVRKTAMSPVNDT